MAFDRKLYNKMLDDIKQEYINKTDWSQKFEEAGHLKDKREVLNLLIERFNLDFDDALLITEHLIDKKPFPDEEIEKPVLTKEDREYIDRLTNKPKCITCGSTNIKKISTSAKVVGAVAFGLFSKTAKSQFKCENCGCKW